MVFPDLLLMFGYVCIDFVVEFGYEWVIGVRFSEKVSIVDFCENMLWDWFVSIVNIAFGDEFFICLDDGVCYEFGFMMDVV